MPTVHREGPYRFYFYSNENQTGERPEPPHIHVDRDDDSAEFWIDPVQKEEKANYGFSRRELRRILRIVQKNQAHLLGEWKKRFPDKPKQSP
ncbi:MAG: DUF4160 domain-containing protein [Bacteroidota bacterium]